MGVCRMTPGIGALKAGERLLSKVYGESREAFVLACFADRRILTTRVAIVSGYSPVTIARLVFWIKQGAVNPSPRRARTLTDVYQALLICAGQVHSRTLGHEGFGLLSYETKTCKTGLCDEVMREVQAVFTSRGSNAVHIAKELGKCRHWYYVNKQNAFCECQTPARCENWERIIDAFKRRND